MEFLTKNQKRLLMTGDGKLESNWDGGFISAEGKDVIVIGVSRPSSFIVFCTPSRLACGRSLRMPFFFLGKYVVYHTYTSLETLYWRVSAV